MSARRSEAAGDPDAPRRAWRWDRRRAAWVPDGDWGGDHGLEVVKRGRDPKWRAMAKRVGCVAARGTADEAKAALEAWLDTVSAPREAPKRVVGDPLPEPVAGGVVRRFIAGEQVFMIALDPGLDILAIEDAIRRRMLGEAAPRREHDGFDGKLSDVERNSVAADVEDPHRRRTSRLAWESRGRQFDVVVPPGQGLRVVVDRGLSAGALMCWAVELDPPRARRRVSRVEIRVHYDVDE